MSLYDAEYDYDIEDFETDAIIEELEDRGFSVISTDDPFLKLRSPSLNWADDVVLFLDRFHDTDLKEMLELLKKRRNL